MKRIGVIGAGAWGTALAVVVGRAGRAVTMWAHVAEVVADINRNHRNEALLPGVTLEPSIRATADLAEAAAADMLLLTVPAQFLRKVASGLAPFLSPGTPVVICAKGIETESGAGVMTPVMPAWLTM